jgi:hypothetical protein
MSLAAASLAATAVSAAGSLASGVAQAGQARRAAAAADANAEEAAQQGQAQADLIRERAARLRGTNRANAGASGIDISGFADAFDDNDISAELDALTAIRNAKMQAGNFKSEAAAQRSGATGALIGGTIGAGTQALSGYGNWRLLQTMPGASGGFEWAVPAGGHGGAR